MELAYSEFQEMLRRTAREFAQKDYPISKHRQLVEGGGTFDPETWKKMAGLGWLGLLVKEAYGGSGGGWVDLTVLLEEMGRALMSSVFLSHTLAARIVQEYGTESQKAALLPAIVQGDKISAVAIVESRATHDQQGVQCTGAEGREGYTLSGTKHFVRGGIAAHTLFVLARLGNNLGLFVVDKGTPKIKVQALDNIGDDDLAKVELANVKVPREALLGQRPLEWSVLRRIVDMGALMECAYGVGIMARDTELTVQYVKGRVQFGRPIGSFQAVQHQVADQVTDVQCGRLLTLYAAWCVDEGLPNARLEIARAKAWVSDALRRVARTGQQLHGGIGFSKEYDIHLYYQRAKTCELTFGLADEHREVIAAALLG